MPVISKHRTVVGIILLVLSTLYIFPEMVFNARLVTIVGDMNSTIETIHKVELFGRAISGVGVSLLILSLLSANLYQKPLKFFFIASAIVTVSWPLTFFGQKWAVDMWVVEPSVAKDRQRATISLLIKDALANNAINIDGIDFNPDANASPKNLTFLTLFGGLLYTDTEIQSSLDKDVINIIRHYLKVKAYNNFDVRYQEYTDVYHNIATRYDEYADASQQYNIIINNIGEEQNKVLVELEDIFQKSFKQYQTSQKAFQAKALARAQEFGPKIFRYFKDIEGCEKRTDKIRCKERQKAGYRKMINSADLGYIEPKFFLPEEDNSTAENSLVSVILGGVSTILDTFDAIIAVNGGLSNKRYHATDKIDFYQRKFSQKMAPQFVDEIGYPTNLNEFTEFKTHGTTQNNAHVKLRAKGLVLSENWHTDDTGSLFYVIATKVKTNANELWQQQMSKQNLDLKPNQAWGIFQQHPSVQGVLAEKLGDYYLEEMRIDLNERQFQLTIMDPLIEKRTLQFLNQYQASEALFENGQIYEQQGKDALRTVLIPPLSMAISLVLICLTLCTLPAKYYGMIGNKTGMGGVILSFFFIPIILLIPMSLSSSYNLVESNPTINYFFKKMDEQVSPLYSMLLRWTLNTQPFMLPIGEGINNVMGIYEGFDYPALVLNQWDEEFNKIRDLAGEIKTNHQMATLYISRFPHDARIRIMNIGPKFKQGMMLPFGKYDIEVSHSKYQNIRKWVELKKSQEQLNINLSGSDI